MRTMLRVLGQRRHPNSPGPPAVVAPLVAELLCHPRHQFWPDSLSLLEQSGVDVSRLLEARQLTDTCLLALAVRHGGHLASFDRRLNCEGVAGGREALDPAGDETRCAPNIGPWPPSISTTST